MRMTIAPNTGTNPVAMNHGKTAGVMAGVTGTTTTAARTAAEAQSRLPKTAAQSVLTARM